MWLTRSLKYTILKPSAQSGTGYAILPNVWYLPAKSPRIQKQPVKLSSFPLPPLQSVKGMMMAYQVVLDSWDALRITNMMKLLSQYLLRYVADWVPESGPW